MSTFNQIGAVISAAITGNPALAALNAKAIYAGTPPEKVLPCITIDGTFTVDAKTRQRGATIHLWMPIAAPAKAGDILDIADAFVSSLKNTPVHIDNWVHQPDPGKAVDHVVFPATIYLDLL